MPDILAPKCVCDCVCELADAGSHMLWYGVGMLVVWWYGGVGMVCGVVLRGSWGSIDVPALLAPKCVCDCVCTGTCWEPHVVVWCWYGGVGMVV